MDNNNNKDKEADGLVERWISKRLDKKGLTTLTKDDYQFFKDFVNKKKNNRFYEAARYNNSKSNWLSITTPEDRDIFEGLRPLRAQSRSLSQNNSIMKKFLEMCEANIAGHTGFGVQVIGEDSNGHLDTAGNRAVKKAWDDWCNSTYCDVTGKLTFNEITRIASRTVPKDGEVLIRKVKQKATRQNPWGFSLQMLDAERLDINFNSVLASGNIVKMGVEMDQYGRPLAYWLRLSGNNTNMALVGSYEGQSRERVPAEDIYHIFEVVNPEQTRGVPWAHAVMTLMSDLEEFLRACLMASKIGAASSIYLERDLTNSSLAPEDIADMQDQFENFQMDVEPGSIRMLPPGLKMSTFLAQYPSANFTSYVQTMLKLIASGLNISYFTIANALEGVSYTSSRTGLLEERSQWLKKQDFFINEFICPVFQDWLEISLLNGAVKFPNGMVMNATKFDKFKNIKVQGVRWPWVDPLKDVQSIILAVKNGFMSRTEAIASLGRDYEQILQDRKAEMELEEQYGVSFDMTDTKGGLDIPFNTEDAEDGTENGSTAPQANVDPTAKTAEKP